MSGAGFRFSNLKTKSKVLIGVCAPLVLLTAVGGIALNDIDKISHTNKWVDHTRVVLAEASAIVASAVDMETGMRGYLLAGRDEFLEPYINGEKQTYAGIAALKETVSDNPGQVARLGEIETVLKEWQSKVTSMQIQLRRNIGDAETMNTFDIEFSVDEELLSAVSQEVQKDLSDRAGPGENCAYQAGYFCYRMSRLKPIKIQLPGNVLKLVDKVALESEEFDRLHYCVHETEFQNTLQFPINEYVSIFAALMLMNSVKTDRSGSPFYFADADKLDDFVTMLSQSDLGKDGVRIILEILFENLLASYARPLDLSD